MPRDGERESHSAALATSALSTHEAAADPHTGYLKEADVNAKGDLFVGTADNTVGRLAVGANGQVLVPASGETTGQKWANGPSMTKFTRRTSGNRIVNDVAYADLDTTLDLVLPAATGDVIEVACNGLWNNEVSQNGFLDVATVVSGSPVNYFSSGTGTPVGDGIIAWQGDSGQYRMPGPPICYTLQAGDISSATVTLRLRCKNPVGGTKTLFATSSIPFYWQARNLGPLAA